MDASGSRPQDILHVGVADVDGVIPQCVGTLQGKIEKGGVGLGTAAGGRDDLKIEIAAQVVVTQDGSQCRAPIRDDAHRIAPLQSRQRRQHIGVDLPSSMQVEFRQCRGHATLQ